MNEYAVLLYSLIQSTVITFVPIVNLPKPVLISAALALLAISKEKYTLEPSTTRPVIFSDLLVDAIFLLRAKLPLVSIKATYAS